MVSRSLLVSKPLQRKLPIRRINLLSIIATFIYHNFRDNVIMISQFYIYRSRSIVIIQYIIEENES